MEILQVNIDDIKVNPYQPRLEFSEEKLSELARSIEENGILQPIVLRLKDDSYEIVAGERRYRAAKLVGLKKINSVIIDVDDNESAKLAIIENIQRENLNPIEEGLGYKKILSSFNMTQEELGEKLGKSRPYISNTIRLLDLDDLVQKYIIDGKISTGHGKLLLSIKEKALQVKIADEIIKNQLTVKQTKSIIDSMGKGNKKLKPKDSYIQSLEEDLMSYFGTKVNLIQKKEKGIIEIEFYNDEDLERILEMFIEQS